MSKPEKLIAQINEFLDGKISKNELNQLILYKIYCHEKTNFNSPFACLPCVIWTKDKSR